MKKFDLSILTIAVALVGLALLGATQPSVQGAEAESAYAAKVNSVEISQQEFLSTLKRENGEKVLEELIEEVLIKQEAARQKVDATPEEINKELQKLKARLKTPEKYQEFLKHNELTEESVKEKLRTQVVFGKMLDKRVAVTEEEMKKYFEENKSKLGPNATYEQNKDKIKQVLVNKKKRKEVKKFLNELKAAAKIEKAAGME